MCDDHEVNHNYNDCKRKLEHNNDVNDNRKLLLKGCCKRTVCLIEFNPHKMLQLLK